MMYKCLIVDDEPLACRFLEDCIARVEILELVKACTSAVEALTLLQQRSIDVLFLDIQMPEINGIELLGSLNKPPRVVMTTAYDNFAVESYNFNVVDYLLKPFSFARFLKAVDKLSTEAPAAATPVSDAAQMLDFIFVNNNGSIERLDLREVYYIRGMGDYVGIRTADKTLMVRDNLKQIEQLLGGSNFIRVHKSYIVAAGKIDSIKGGVINILDEKISVGALYKNHFLREINRLKIG